MFTHEAVDSNDKIITIYWGSPSGHTVVLQSFYEGGFSGSVVQSFKSCTLGTSSVD